MTEHGLIPHLTRRGRLIILTVHVLTSVGMAGIDGTLVVLQLLALHSGKPNPGINLLAVWVLTPTAGTALGTGLTLAVAGPWGLRRRWIIAKLEISGMLTAAGVCSLAGLLDPVTVLAARGCALIALTVVVAVSVVKPGDRRRTAVQQPAAVPAQRVVGYTG